MPTGYSYLYGIDYTLVDLTAPANGTIQRSLAQRMQLDPGAPANILLMLAVVQ
jgi:hypothetical protein